VWDYLPEFIEALKAQLKDDEIRWGDTWKKRIKLGQETRIYNDITDYFDQWESGGNPIPWLKVAGLALIAWIRDNNPEDFQG
jgi:hypothetical protein